MPVIHDFFEAFKRKDFKAMQACYHEQASFTDPVFGTLNVDQVRAMWDMLLSRNKDLQLDYHIISFHNGQTVVEWVATYTFTATQRQVRNVVQSTFTLKDQKILVQKDKFDLWKWSAMALGFSGTLLGWTPLFKNKLRSTAAAGLKKFMEKPKPQ